ncbi:hypothetical protein B484DRAFT_453262 [Ochromonadaceae sp. CCMP2298]|nr:hypothetical protein B484DRAFT_453262 [Ochromonadaceae sp. CCMP2298]
MMSDQVDWKAAAVKRFIASTLWRAADDKGKTYYYNKNTKATQWDEPEEIARHRRLMEEAESEEHLARILNPDTPVGEEAVVDAGADEGATAGTKRGFDGTGVSFPARRSKQQLLDIMASRDAVMEPGAAAVAGELAELTDREQVAELLAGSYSGYQQLSRVVVEWIRKAKMSVSEAKDGGSGAGGAPDVPSTAPASATAIEATKMDTFGETLVAGVLAQVVIQRFSRKLADDLVVEGALPDSVGHMLSQPKYREVLRELYKQHPHSKLLSLCIPSLTEP